MNESRKELQTEGSVGKKKKESVRGEIKVHPDLLVILSKKGTTRNGSLRCKKVTVHRTSFRWYANASLV